MSEPTFKQDDEVIVVFAMGDFTQNVLVHQENMTRGDVIAQAVLDAEENPLWAERGENDQWVMGVFRDGEVPPWVNAVRRDGVGDWKILVNGKPLLRIQFPEKFPRIARVTAMPEPGSGDDGRETLLGQLRINEKGVV